MRRPDWTASHSPEADTGCAGAAGVALVASWPDRLSPSSGDCRKRLTLGNQTGNRHGQRQLVFHEDRGKHDKDALHNAHSPLVWKVHHGLQSVTILPARARGMNANT